MDNWSQTDLVNKTVLLMFFIIAETIELHEGGGDGGPEGEGDHREDLQGGLSLIAAQRKVKERERPLSGTLSVPPSTHCPPLPSTLQQ